jgi:hypothetical protein
MLEGKNCNSCCFHPGPVLSDQPQRVLLDLPDKLYGKIEMWRSLWSAFSVLLAKAWSLGPIHEYLQSVTQQNRPVGMEVKQLPRILQR